MAVPSSVAPQAPPSVPAPTLELALEPLPASTLPDPAPKLEIVEPAFGQLVEAAGSRAAEVRIRTENIRLTREEEGVLVSLDGGRPRRLLMESQLRLGDLLREDEELQPGAHSVFAVAVDASGRVLRGPLPNGGLAFSLVEFFVGIRNGNADAKLPRLFCSSPVGTHYVSKTTRLTLDVLPVGFAPETAELHVAAGGLFGVIAFDPSRAHFITGLPLGDVELTVTAAPGVRARCVTTLNPGVEETASE